MLGTGGAIERPTSESQGFATLKQSLASDSGVRETRANLRSSASSLLSPYFEGSLLQPRFCPLVFAGGFLFKIFYYTIYEICFYMIKLSMFAPFSL